MSHLFAFGDEFWSFTMKSFGWNRRQRGQLHLAASTQAEVKPHQASRSEGARVLIPPSAAGYRGARLPTFRDWTVERAKFRTRCGAGSGIRSRIRRNPLTGDEEH